MTKHKWHDEIVAWAGGAEIEYQVADGGQWFLTDAPAWWVTGFKFRIKKEPVIEVAYFRHSVNGAMSYDNYYAQIIVSLGTKWDLKITYQDGKAIKAELPT